MRNGLVHVLAWLLATGAAATLSWWGVHTVMAGTAYQPPRALTVAAADAATRSPRPAAPEPPAPSATRPPTSATASSGSPSATASATPPRTPAPAASASPTATASGRVKAYDTDGGRAVFDLGASDATLVSATPGAGWSMQVWRTTTWIRVDFARGADRVSVFCAWHDGPPHVDINTF
ncbi:hypothetical protein ACIQVT_32000 [Streptomyces sp. NPDC100445]|uniref:hypothetical protein n=1 Tax=Streptomyces sp. NPDC100445 TaxID=3366102 RepID=UPI0038077AC3